MSKPTKKETLKWLEGEISRCEKRLDSVIKMGWGDKGAVIASNLRDLKAFRILFYKQMITQERLNKHADYLWAADLDKKGCRKHLQSLLAEFGITVEGK